MRFCRNGYKLDKPQAVERVTQEYREREDWLSNFINERCIKGPNERASASALYSVYKEWATSTGDYVRRLNDFNSAMEIAGYQKIRPNNKKSWLGLSIDYDRDF